MLNLQFPVSAVNSMCCCCCCDISFAARVVVNLRVASLVEGVAFQRSSYNFSLPENRPAGEAVGKVLALTGSDLYGVAYTLKTHTDLFSVNADGTIVTKTQLDKEEQEWYLLEVEAVDTRTPPMSAITMVRPVLVYSLIQHT